MKTVLNKIIVEPSDKGAIETASGLIGMDSKEANFLEGVVVDIGELVEKVNVGDTVIYDKNRSHNIIIDGKQVVVIEINCIFVIK